MQTTKTPEQNVVRELSINEIDEVSGGVIWNVAIAITLSSFKAECSYEG